MKAREVKAKEVPQLLEYLASWLSSIQPNYVNKDDFIFDLSDCVVLNRLLVLLPEAKLKADDFFDPVENDIESNENFNTFKTTCIKKLGFKEGEIFDQALLQADTIEEVLTDENLFKFLRALVSLAHIAINEPSLTDYMSSGFADYLSGKSILAEEDLDPNEAVLPAAEPTESPLIPSASSSASSPIVQIVAPTQEVPIKDTMIDFSKLDQETSEEPAPLEIEENLNPRVIEEAVPVHTKQTATRSNPLSDWLSKLSTLGAGSLPEYLKFIIALVVGFIIGLPFNPFGKTLSLPYGIPCNKLKDTWLHGHKYINYYCYTTNFVHDPLNVNGYTLSIKESTLQEISPTLAKSNGSSTFIFIALGVLSIGALALSPVFPNLKKQKKKSD